MLLPITLVVPGTKGTLSAPLPLIAFDQGGGLSIQLDASAGVGDAVAIYGSVLNSGVTSTSQLQPIVELNIPGASGDGRLPVFAVPPTPFPYIYAVRTAIGTPGPLILSVSGQESFSVIGPPGPPGPAEPSSLIYQPGGAPSGNIYVTDVALAAAGAALNWAVKVEVDTSVIAFANAPWTLHSDLTGSCWVGKYPGTVIETSGGGFMLNPSEMANLTVTTNDAGVPALQFQPNIITDFTFRMTRSTIQKQAGGIAPMTVSLAGAKRFIWFIDQCPNPLDNSLSPGNYVVNLTAAGEQCLVWLTRGAPGTSLQGKIVGDAASSLSFLFDDSVNPFFLSQGGYVGAFSAASTVFNGLSTTQPGPVVRPFVLYAVSGASLNGADGSVQNPFPTISAAMAAVSQDKTTILCAGGFGENVVWNDNFDGTSLIGIGGFRATTVNSANALPAIGWIGAPGSACHSCLIQGLGIYNFGGGDAVNFNGNAVAGGNGFNSGLRLADCDIDTGNVLGKYDFFVSAVSSVQLVGSSFNSNPGSCIKSINSSVSIYSPQNVGEYVNVADFTQPLSSGTISLSVLIGAGSIGSFVGVGPSLNIVGPGSIATNIDMSGLTSDNIGGPGGPGVRGTFLCAGIMGTPVTLGSSGTAVVHIPAVPTNPFIVLPFQILSGVVFATFSVTSSAIAQEVYDCRETKFMSQLPSSISAGNMVTLDLRNSAFDDTLLTFAGSGAIDRSMVQVLGQGNPGVAGTTINVPHAPLPSGNYQVVPTVSVVGLGAIAVTSKTGTSFLAKSGNAVAGTVDYTILKTAS